MTRNFGKADEQFVVLSYFYDNWGKVLPPSDLESKVITLRLVHLFAQGNYEEFHSIKATVRFDLKRSPEFKHLNEFVYFMEIGSFKSASDAIGNISLVHKAVLSQIEDSLHEEFADKDMPHDRLVLPRFRTGGSVAGVRNQEGRH